MAPDTVRRSGTGSRALTRASTNCRRQTSSGPLLMPCRRATAICEPPGFRFSIVIARFCLGANNPRLAPAPE